MKKIATALLSCALAAATLAGCAANAAQVDVYKRQKEEKGDSFGPASPWISFQ